MQSPKTRPIFIIFLVCELFVLLSLVNNLELYYNTLIGTLALDFQLTKSNHSIIQCFHDHYANYFNTLIHHIAMPLTTHFFISYSCPQKFSMFPTIHFIKNIFGNLITLLMNLYKKISINKNLQLINIFHIIRWINYPTFFGYLFQYSTHLFLISN